MKSYGVLQQLGCKCVSPLDLHSLPLTLSASAPSWVSRLRRFMKGLYILVKNHFMSPIHPELVRPPSGANPVAGQPIFELILSWFDGNVSSSPVPTQCGLFSDDLIAPYLIFVRSQLIRSAYHFSKPIYWPLPDNERFPKGATWII